MYDKISTFLDNKLPSYLDLLRQMVEINSFSANPAGVNQLGELTAQVFSRLGFAAEYVPSVNPGFGNHLFLDLPARQPAVDESRPENFIALVSHLDTVFPPEEEALNDFHYRVEGERIYGPGTVDIKGGTVMIYAVLEVMRAMYPQVFAQTHWLVAVDATEETLSEDFGALCRARIPPGARACLVFEGGTPSRRRSPVVVARKGRAEFLIQAEGRGAHAGNYHKQGANAILQLADTIQRVSALTDYDKQITFNVGVVNGGSVVNRVPHQAQALVEMRAFSPEIFSQGIQDVLALDGGTTISSGDGYPCRVSVQMKSRTHPWPRNPGSDHLLAVWEQIGNALGMRVVPEERGGLSDGNQLWEHCPVLDGLGPAGTNAHCSERSDDGSKDQEYMLIPSFVPKAALNVLSIVRLLEANAEPDA